MTCKIFTYKPIPGTVGPSGWPLCEVIEEPMTDEEALEVIKSMMPDPNGEKMDIGDQVKVLRLDE